MAYPGLTFRNLVEFYRQAHFLYPSKSANLESHFSAVEETWTKLLAANDDIFKLVVRSEQVGGREVIKNAVCAFAYASRTWQVQHLVSAFDRAPRLATLAILTDIVDWLGNHPDINHVRFAYRPNNAAPRRLFQQLHTALGSDQVALHRADYLKVPLAALPISLQGDESSVSVSRVSAADWPAVYRFYARKLPRVALAALAIEDPDLVWLDARFSAWGLRRKRAIFAARHHGEVVGAAICNAPSDGINFSGLESALEHLELADSSDSAVREVVLISLLAAARSYYADAGYAWLTALIDPAYRDICDQLVVHDRDGHQYDVLTIDTDNGAPAETLRAFEAYYRDHLRKMAARQTTLI